MHPFVFLNMENRTASAEFAKHPINWRDCTDVCSLFSNDKIHITVFIGCVEKSNLTQNLKRRVEYKMFVS